MLRRMTCRTEHFITLWKDADPDIPILKQAKARNCSDFLQIALAKRVAPD